MLSSLFKGAYESYFPGCSSRCRRRDLYQTQPEDWWIYPASRLWMEHGWVGRSCLWVSYGPDQLPSFHFPGLHTPTGESEPPSNRLPTKPATLSLFFRLILSAVKWSVALLCFFGNRDVIILLLLYFSNKFTSVLWCFTICSSHPY